MEEWNIDLPWGKVAMVSWGNRKKQPILLLHGYMDTAATFIPLINELPEEYYYVAFDIPGHGKSQPFPPGSIVTQVHVVEVIRKIVAEMKWKSFLFIAHSMGCVIGLFYNYLYPGKISKMILLDPGPPIALYYYVHDKVQYWYHYFYGEFFSNYDRWTTDRTRLYTQEEAIMLVVRNRNITEEQAEIVLSRSLVPMENNKYKFSWEPRMKKIGTFPLSEETFYTVIATSPPPTLVLASSQNSLVEPSKSFALNIFEKCQALYKHFVVKEVEGGHDVHISDSDVVANYIKTFLSCPKNKYNANCVKCKI